MSNRFLDLPVPAANGAGAAVDTSNMGATKTIIVGGPFQGSVTIEYSNDLAAAVWAPVPNATFTNNPGRVTIDLAVRWMRAVMDGYKGGAANADVGASDVIGSGFYAALGPVALDISDMPPFKTVVVDGPCIVEFSEDGVSWSQAFSFQSQGGQSAVLIAQFARVTGGASAWIGATDLSDEESEILPPFTPTTITIYARPTGSDSTGTGTLANPYATMQRAVRDVPIDIPAGVRYVVDITGVTEVTPANYEFPAWKSPAGVEEPTPTDPFFTFKLAVNINAIPRLMAALTVGDATITPAQIIAQTAQVGSGLLSVEISRTGTGDSFVEAAGVVTLTDAAALFTATMVGMPIVITGATSPANNGTFVVASFISATQITYANTNPGVTEAFAGTWVIGTPRAAWGVNLLKGKFLIGATALEHAVVIDNTTSAMTITQITALTGTLFLMEPSADITCSSIVTAAVRGGMAARNCDSLALNGLRITTPTAGNSFGLEVGGNGVYSVQMCELQVPLLVSSAVNLNRYNRLWMRGLRMRLTGSYSLTGSLFDAIPTVRLLDFGPVVAGWRRNAAVGCGTLDMCSTSFPGEAAINSVAAHTFVADNTLVTGAVGATSDGLRFHGVRGVLRNADIRANGRDGIRMDSGPGFLELLNVRTTVVNTGNGITLNDGMVVKVDASTSGATATTTQLRGTAGEMKVGGGATRTWALFVSGADGRPALNEYDITAAAATGATGTGSRLFQ